MVVESPSDIPIERRPIRVGIIGLGVRGMHSVARNMAETFSETGLEVAAISDRNRARMDDASRVLVSEYEDEGKHVEPVLYERGIDLIADPTLDLVVITTSTDSHREYAIPALRSGKKVYCDKPLAQTVEDAAAIRQAERQTGNLMMMGFTRRFESPWIRAHAMLEAGTIGRLVMVQIRTIIPYHRYLTGWWRRREWSGGALNDKGSHLFDVFNWFSGSEAVEVSGYGGRSMIQPDPSAPARCQECTRVCMYRRRAWRTGEPVAPDLKTLSGSSRALESEEKFVDDNCVYRPGADIYHNGSIRFSNANGVIATYLYTILGPSSDDEETLELIGTKGRMILTRHTGNINIATTDGAESKDIVCRSEDFGDSHFGADKQMMRELRQFCEGAPPSVSAADGLEATRMVMAALSSMDQNGRQVAMEDEHDANE